MKTRTINIFEIARLKDLRGFIEKDLQCDEAGGIPCRTCRRDLLKHMVRYIQICIPPGRGVLIAARGIQPKKPRKVTV